MYACRCRWYMLLASGILDPWFCHLRKCSTGERVEASKRSCKKALEYPQSMSDLTGVNQQLLPFFILEGRKTAAWTNN
eukprot:535795-Pelagomonas_calceolata.AAC.2